MFKLSVFLTLFCLCVTGVGAQQGNQTLVEAEKNIHSLLLKIANEESFVEKNNLNNELISLFYEALEHTDAFSFPFSTLTNIGNLKSDDNKLRIFTWNIPQPQGQQKYFGFLMVNHPDSPKIYPLTDNRNLLEDPQNEITSPEKWHGALYYSIVEVKHSNKTLYTLLGVDLNNMFSTKRIIEVISLDDEGKPLLGFPIFKIRNNVISRVIFEYSSRANMMLSWEKDKQMLVFNHLMPLRPDFVGNYQFYVPDLSYDGFRFANNYWEYVPDLDVRNANREKATPINAPIENYEPGFIYAPNKLK